MKGDNHQRSFGTLKDSFWSIFVVIWSSTEVPWKKIAKGEPSTLFFLKKKKSQNLSNMQLLLQAISQEECLFPKFLYIS